MSKIVSTTPVPLYNPRWFVWTVMFLLVTGVSLVSYIILSDPAIESGGETVRHVVKKPVAMPEQ